MAFAHLDLRFARFMPEQPAFVVALLHVVASPAAALVRFLRATTERRGATQLEAPPAEIAHLDAAVRSAAGEE